MNSRPNAALRNSPTPVNKAQHVKLVMLGDQGVGKSSIALRFVRGEFRDNSEATIGAAFLTQTVNVQNQSIKFDIWDTAGQERYHSLAPMYYRGAQASIVVYDVNNANTFTRAINWVRELRQHANAHIIIVLAGNKADMAAEHRAVQKEDAQTFAMENNLIFAEVSAKTGMAVADIFLTVANRLARRPDQGPSIEGGQSRVRVTGEEVKSKKGCC